MTRIAKRTKIVALALAGLTLLSIPASAGGGWGGGGWGGGGYYGRGGPGPGYYGRGYGPGPGYYGYRRNNNGAAVAAGIVGGLVLGGLAAQAYNRPRCWTETQTRYNRYGRPFYRDVQVCR